LLTSPPISIIYEIQFTNEPQKLFLKILAVDSTNMKALINLAILYTGFLADREKAEKYFNQAIQFHPNHEEPYRAFSRFMSRYQFDKSQELLLCAYNINPNNPETLCQLGLNAIPTNNYDLAEYYFIKSTEVAPNYAFGFTNLARIYNEVHGDYNRAEQVYKQSLRIAPYSFKANFQLAVMLHYKLKEYQEAEIFYKKKVLIIKPDHLDTQLLQKKSTKYDR